MHFQYGNYSDDLTIEISDYSKGRDRLILVIDEDSHPEFAENEAQLVNLFLYGDMIDYKNDGTANELYFELTLTNLINNNLQRMTVVLESIGTHLTADDLQIMTFAEFDTYQDEKIEAYLNELL